MRGLVDGEVDRAAHAHVVERRVLRVHRQVADVVGRRRGAASSSGCSATNCRSSGDRFSATSMAPPSSATSRWRAIADGDEHEVLDLGRAVPVARVGREHDALARRPLDEAERPGADGMARELGAPLAHRRRRDDRDREHRQVGEERRVGALDGDAHGVGVDRLDRLDVAEVVLPVGEVVLVVRDGADRAGGRS